MTMALGAGEFFDSYLQALSLKQLEALTEWQNIRLAEKPSKDIVTDALAKKRTIYLEIRRRRERTQV